MLMKKLSNHHKFFFLTLMSVFLLASCQKNLVPGNIPNEENTIVPSENDSTSSTEKDTTENEIQSSSTSWIITQYGDEKNSVMMFYTIEDTAGNLVVIDGGYDNNADKVREVIAEHNNHVFAWIITHPHPDHVMAFNEIMKNPGAITVDKVYTIEVNYDRYKETAQWYDRFDIYEEFLTITKNLDNVTYLKENDELTIIGLNMKVLHSWNEETETLEENAVNNGSLIFTLEGNSETFLFCADVENETEQFIIERHLADLKDVDYIQLGHHGNWGMTKDFYKHIEPKAVFFDVPSWLIEDEDSSYDAWKLWDYFEDRNIKMFVINPEPNVIIFE